MKKEVGYVCSAEEPSVCKPLCGDDIVTTPEKCELSDSECRHDCMEFMYGWYRTSSTTYKSTCGDSIKVSDEECDNGKEEGCLADCSIDSKYTCSIDQNLKSLCTKICGNGRRDHGEECDDFNQVEKDGCTDCKQDDYF
jgi:cysteine-rich repeat protein